MKLMQDKVVLLTGAAQGICVNSIYPGDIHTPSQKK